MQTFMYINSTRRILACMEFSAFPT